MQRYIIEGGRTKACALHGQYIANPGAASRTADGSGTDDKWIPSTVIDRFPCEMLCLKAEFAALKYTVSRYVEVDVA